jgi:C4-type Zn-finger protein
MSKELLTCPLCGNNQFKKEQGRMDSKWGFTSHKITLMICERCNFIMQFSKGRSIFDFD